MFLVAGLIATAVYFLLPRDQQQNLYVGIGAASVLAMVVGVRLHRPAHRLGWYLLAAANACFVAGDEVGDLYLVLTGRTAPVPSVADALYLAGYPLMIAAVFLLARAAGIAASREHRVDAAVITLGALAAAWQPLVQPSAGDPATGLVGRIVAVSYPVLDVGVLFIVVGAVISARSSTVPQRLLVGSIALMLTADVVFTLASLAGTYANGDPVDVGWLLSYVLFGTAALHPDMAATGAADRDDHLHPRRWVVVVSVAAFVPLALVMAHAIRDDAPGFAVPVGFGIVTFAFVGIRTVLLFGRVREQALELAHRAYHDDLTGLPNRAWIRDRLDGALTRADAGGVAFCLADLDRFKAVNDTLGHRTGDQVLVAVGRRLRESSLDGVVVGRLGGDEFACVLPGAGPGEAARVAQWLVDTLREPFQVEGRRIQLSSSVGLATADPGSTGAELFTRADVAMYAAKSGGRDRWRGYEPAMGEHLAEQLTVTSAFPDALRHAQFSLVYQPVFTVTSGALKGFEALVRWDHPTLGPINPDRFVPLAEETGFVVPLGRWVLDTACCAATRWPGGVTVAVNVSARQLEGAGLVDDVVRALRTSGLAPERLVLEVTESAMVDDVAQAGRAVAGLKALGVVIAIDDFGTGHSSLSQLRDLPIDVLKIDKSFVAPLGRSSGRSSAYVEAIVGLARALGMSTVAEGVESQAQYDTLRDLGCDTVQGYLTGRPLAPAAAARLATSSSVTTAGC